jgi:hypothetical protein
VMVVVFELRNVGGGVFHCGLNEEPGLSLK